MTKLVLTKEALQASLPSNRSAGDWLDIVQKYFDKYEINTLNRGAAFISQTGHESKDWQTLEENLNYSVTNINKVFPKYFSRAGRDPKPYAHNPEKLANIVYANRLGNGDTNSGDGWKFRGRGIIQLTGRDHYTNFGKTVGMTPEEVITYITTKEGALEAAVWYWSRNQINKIADTGDVVAISKAINGGDIGLEDRKKRFAEVKKILSAVRVEVVNEPVNKDYKGILLTIGSRSDIVKDLQKALGMPLSGVYGPLTHEAVKRYQAANGLDVDGIAGPKTLTKILG